MSSMNSVVHFEMPYDDRERMAKFYENVFGWQTQMLGEEMDNYVLAATTQTDERPQATKRDQWRLFFRGSPIGRRNTLPSSSQSMTFTCQMSQVTDAGGTILGEPLTIQGVGQYVSFFDTEGNRVSMLQPIPRN